MSTIRDVELHEKHANLNVVAMRNALERHNPNHHDICLIVGLLETWLDGCSAADMSEQQEMVADLWVSLQEVYSTTPEERAEWVREQMVGDRRAA